MEKLFSLLVPVAWMAAALIFRRLRRRTRGYAEGQEMKARLPFWVQQVELCVQAVLWPPLFFGFFLTMIRMHALAAGGRPAGPLAMILICMAAGLVTAPLAMLAANLISWIVPALRRANLVAMQGLPMASFGQANRGLLLMAAVLVPAGLAQGLLGALEPWAR